MAISPKPLCCSAVAPLGCSLTVARWILLPTTTRHDSTAALSMGHGPFLPPALILPLFPCLQPQDPPLLQSSAVQLSAARCPLATLAGYKRVRYWNTCPAVTPKRSSMNGHRRRDLHTSWACPSTFGGT